MMTASRPIHTSLPMTVLSRLGIVGSSSAVRSNEVRLAQWKNADLLPLDTTARADILRRVVGGGGEVIAGEGVHQRRRSRDRECPDGARPVPRLVEVAPSAIFLFVANPVDVVTYATLRISGLPRS